MLLKKRSPGYPGFLITPITPGESLCEKMMSRIVNLGASIY